MEAKKIIQAGYSIILYKILNEIRRDDDGDCDIYHCATFKYEYYDHFLITYNPYDNLEAYDMRGVFYITFYQKYDINIIKEAMLEVHQFWKKDVQSILKKCNNKWVVKVEDGILNLENTLGLVDSENFLMKPLNDTTFMTLFYVPNYFDYYRIAQIAPRHLIENFIIYEKEFYNRIIKYCYEEYQYERLIKSGYKNDYVCDYTFTTIKKVRNKKNSINTESHHFNLLPYINEKMEAIIMVKAYAQMVYKIINREFNNVFNNNYSIKFIKNMQNDYFVIMEFAKSTSFEMITKSISYVNDIIQEKMGKNVNIDDLVNNENDFVFMKPIYNKMLFSHIHYKNIKAKPDFPNEILTHIYENEMFILDKEIYNSGFDFHNFCYYRDEYKNYSTIIKDHKNIVFYND